MIWRFYFLLGFRYENRVTDQDFNANLTSLLYWPTRLSTLYNLGERIRSSLTRPIKIITNCIYIYRI